MQCRLHFCGYQFEISWLKVRKSRVLTPLLQGVVIWTALCVHIPLKCAKSLRRANVQLTSVSLQGELPLVGGQSGTSLRAGKRYAPVPRVLFALSHCQRIMLAKVASEVCLASCVQHSGCYASSQPILLTGATNTVTFYGSQIMKKTQ